MRELLHSSIWLSAKRCRKWQRLSGCVAAFCLGVALLALFDGLIAQMRGGTNELEFLQGQEMLLSGPAALKNPLASDVIIRFEPPDAPFIFELEGFYTGYWFGNGMWRGKISAGQNAEPGHYSLRIAFRGAPAQSAQNFILLVFGSESAMQAASRTLIRRITGINPFILAAFCGACGIAFGVITYWFGRRFDLGLKALGLSQIYASQGADIWCLAPPDLAPIRGNARMVLDGEGRICGEARAGQWQKGKLKLTLMDGCAPPQAALVCLRHPKPSPEIFTGHSA